jgi:hypothetical protein
MVPEQDVCACAYKRSHTHTGKKRVQKGGDSGKGRLKSESGVIQKSAQIPAVGKIGKRKQRLVTELRCVCMSV